MPSPEPLTHRSIDQVEESLMQRYRRVDINEYHALVDLREYDIRQGWKAWHLNSCAEWLNLKCGISLGAAREKVRVANALLDLPQFSKAMEDGRLSFCKARALTRLARPWNEAELLSFAAHRPTSQVEDYCRQLRNAQRRESTQDVNRIHRNRYLSCVHHDDGSSTIQVNLTREDAELVMKAVEIAGEADPSEGHMDEQDNFFARQADALVDIARTYLDGGTGKAGSTADRYQVMVHVDEAVLRGEMGKSDLPYESLRRITCDCSLVPVVEGKDGDPLNVGRKHRIVPPAVRRALHARDKQCRYPGCTHTRWLQPHHIIHWADGGESSLGNTLLLCSKHHRLHHEGGYEILKDYRDNWYFVTATRRTIPEVPMYRPDEYDAETDTVIISGRSDNASRDARDQGRGLSASVEMTADASRDAFDAEEKKPGDEIREARALYAPA